MLKMTIASSTKRLVVYSGLAGVSGLFLVTWLHIRPMGILFLSTYFFWFYKIKFDAQVIPPEELQIKIKGFIDGMKNMRETNPALFCSIATAVLGISAIVGHLLSGCSVVLICLIFAILMSAKYNFKILKLKTTGYNWSERVQDHNEIDDFLPEVNESNMLLLEHASEQSSTTFTVEDNEEKSEEIPSDLLIPDSIPEIDENSTDEDALDIGVPGEVKRRTSSVEIEFKKSHFKKDSSVSTSSSSDEENLSKGLKFPEYSNIILGPSNSKSTISRINPQTQSMIMTGNLLPNLVSGLVSWASMTSDNRISEPSSSREAFRPAITDDEESDFEIVNTDEYQ